MRTMPQPVKEAYEKLAPANVNNSRQIFRTDWEKVGTSDGKAKVFAERYGLYYDSKHAGEANHPGVKTPNTLDEVIKELLEIEDAGYEISNIF